MRRVLAVGGALLMVAAALLVRALIDGDDDQAATGRDGEPVRLLCAEELADVCSAVGDSEGIEIEVEAVGETVDRLGAPDARLEAEGWLTLDPFPEQVNERREFATRSSLFADPHPTGFSSALGLVAFRDRAAALETACSEVGWSCLGDAAGEPWSDHGGETTWGPVKPGFDAPDRSATGLLVLAQAMADHLDDPGFARQDIDDRWLGEVEDAVPTRTAGSALLRLVQQGRAGFAAVGALGIDAEAAAATAQGRDLSIFYPAPMFRATVVLAPVRGNDLSALAQSDALAEALADAGWERDVDGAPLPSPGVLDALRSAWVAS